MVDASPDYRIFEINKLGRTKGPAQLITCAHSGFAIAAASWEAVTR
jgi:hypothetical protein